MGATGYNLKLAYSLVVLGKAAFMDATTTRFPLVSMVTDVPVKWYWLTYRRVSVSTSFFFNATSVPPR